MNFYNDSYRTSTSTSSNSSSQWYIDIRYRAINLLYLHITIILVKLKKSTNDVKKSTCHIL